jgi:hypothetical protein
MVFITGALGLMVWWYVAHGDHTITFTSGRRSLNMIIVLPTGLKQFESTTWINHFDPGSSKRYPVLHLSTFCVPAGLAYICLGLVAINCIFNLLMSSWSSYSKWSGSNMIKTTTSLATDGCTMIAVSYDKYLLATDPMLTVNVSALHG